MHLLGDIGKRLHALASIIDVEQLHMNRQTLRIGFTRFEQDLFGLRIPPKGQEGVRLGDRIHRLDHIRHRSAGGAELTGFLFARRRSDRRRIEHRIRRHIGFDDNRFGRPSFVTLATIGRKT